MHISYANMHDSEQKSMSVDFMYIPHKLNMDVIKHNRFIKTLPLLSYSSDLISLISSNIGFLKLR
jgi:hypothetical protein